MNPEIEAAIRRAEPPGAGPRDWRIRQATWALARELHSIDGFADTIGDTVPQDILTHYWSIHGSAMGEDITMTDIETALDRAPVRKRDKLAGFDLDEVIRRARLRATETDDLSTCRIEEHHRVLAFACEEFQQLANDKANSDQERPVPFSLDQKTAARIMGKFLKGGKDKGKPDSGAGRDGLKLLEKRGIIKLVAAGSKRAKGEKGEASTFIYIGETATPDGW